jgi:addiction module HigA family antidote
MLASFRDPETERLWQTGKSRRLPPDLHLRAFKKLAILNASVALENLKVPPGNHLETLRGNRAGRHSMRISNQYRVCFAWRAGNALEVEIVDYHRGLDERTFQLGSAVSTNRGAAMAKPKRKAFAVHPGEILKTEFMEPMGVSGYALAKALHFPGIYEVVRGARAISADTALRLGRYFGLPAQFWLNLQNDYDLRIASRSSAAERIRPRAQSSRLASAAP